MTAEELWGLYNDKRILILPCPIEEAEDAARLLNRGGRI